MPAKKRSRNRSNWPSTGALENNVDAILKSRGLELNAPVEKILERSQRRRNKFVENAQKRQLR